MLPGSPATTRYEFPIARHQSKGMKIYLADHWSCGNETIRSSSPLVQPGMHIPYSAPGFQKRSNDNWLLRLSSDDSCGFLLLLSRFQYLFFSVLIYFQTCDCVSVSVSLL